MRTIIEMVKPHPPRLRGWAAPPGCAPGVAAAIHHDSHRSVFGTVLAEQPLMRNVLADLAVWSSRIGSDDHPALRLARAYDEALAGNEDATNFKRVANAVLKYWITKRAPSPRRRVARVPRRATATSRSRGCRASSARVR